MKVSYINCCVSSAINSLLCSRSLYTLSFLIERLRGDLRGAQGRGPKPMYTFDKYYDDAHHKGPVYMQEALRSRGRTVTVDSGRLNIGSCKIILEIF